MAHPSDDIHERFVASRDLCRLFVGERLGSGMSRAVYAVERDPTLVIKFEPEGTTFQNPMEWNVWQAVKDTDMERWFAPCVDISPNGLWLLQKRVTPLPKEKYPKKLPDFLGDTKYTNFGMLGKRFVVCDYGTPSMCRLMHFRKKLTKAHWWGEELIDG